MIAHEMAMAIAMWCATPSQRLVATPFQIQDCRIRLTECIERSLTPPYKQWGLECFEKNPYPGEFDHD